MGKVVDINEYSKKKAEESKQVEENIQILKNQIEQNLYLKYAIRIVNNLAMVDVNKDGELESKYDDAALLEQYKKDALEKGEKFISLGEPTDSESGFYYQLLQTGYRTFGANFFKQMCMNEVNCIHLFKGVWALINALEVMSDGTASLENQLRAYQSLKLTEEQSAQLQQAMSKTPQEFMEELMRQSQELEKENKEDKKE